MDSNSFQQEWLAKRNRKATVLCIWIWFSPNTNIIIVHNIFQSLYKAWCFIIKFTIYEFIINRANDFIINAITFTNIFMEVNS
jgi:hypothetical protein